MAAYTRQFLSSLSRTSHESFTSFKVFLDTVIRNNPPPSALAVIGNPSESFPKKDFKSSLDVDLNSIFNGILLAVPRARRTIERRLKRKHAFTKHFEHATPKINIVPCLDCGNFKEKGHLCKYCYEKVREETKLMQEKMGDDLKYNVPHTEVTFLYEDEAVDKSGRYVVSMDKKRPTWFPRKLLNKAGS